MKNNYMVMTKNGGDLRMNVRMVLFSIFSVCNLNTFSQSHNFNVSDSDSVFQIFVNGYIDGVNTYSDYTIYNELTDIRQEFNPTKKIIIRNNGYDDRENIKLIVNNERDWYTIESLSNEVYRNALTKKDSSLSIFSFFVNNRIFGWAGDAYEETLKQLRIYGYGPCNVTTVNLGDFAYWTGSSSTGRASNKYYGWTHHSIVEVSTDGNPDEKFLLDSDMGVFYLDFNNQNLSSVAQAVNDKYLICRTKHYSKGSPYNQDRNRFTALCYEKDNIPMLRSSTRRNAGLFYDFEINLRPNEEMIFDFGIPTFFRNYPRGRTPPPTLLTGVISNSKFVYSSNFKDKGKNNCLNTNMILDEDVTKPHFHPSKVENGIFIFEFNPPFPILDINIQLLLKQSTTADSIMAYYSTDGSNWELVYISSRVGAFIGSINLHDKIPSVESEALYKYFLKFEFNPKDSAWACGIDSLNIQTTFQCSRFFMPQLRLGENVITYSDASGNDSDRNVEIIVEWQESSSNRPPNKIAAPVFPAPQAEVDSLYFAFTWEAATDDDGDAIADYEFMLSDDERMLYPHSPNFNLYVSCFNEGIKPYFKVKETGWLNDGETYYWRVRAKDERGAWGEWSDTWSFTPHGVMRPVNGRAEVKGQSIHLAWERNPTGKQPDFYKIYASNETNGFSPEAYNLFALCDSSHFTIPFQKDEAPKSFYRIAACDTLGQESLISDAVAIPYPYIYSAYEAVGSSNINNNVENSDGGGVFYQFRLIPNAQFYPYYYNGNDTIHYKPDIAILSKPDWVQAYADTVFMPNDMNLARELLYMDSTQRSIVVSMDDHQGGAATQTLVIETAAKNRKPELALEESALCMQNAYEGFITSIDGDVAFGDTNYYTVLQKPLWLSYSIAGDTVHLWGDVALSTQSDWLITVLAVDSKNDSTIAHFPINAQRLYLLSSSIDTAVEDTHYSYQLQFNRLPDEPTFSFLHLPNWLQMDDQCRLVGTPQIHDLSDTLVHFTVSDHQCPVRTEQTLAIHVRHVNHAPVITTEQLPVAYEGESYNASVSAFDIDSLIEDVGLQYAISPASSWLHVDPQTGMLSGMPLTQHISDTAFLVTVQDKQGYSDAKMLNIPLIPQLHILSASKDTAIEDQRYSYQLQFSGCTDELIFSFIHLPAWLQMDDQLRLIGTPQIHDLSDTLVHFTVSDRQCLVATEHTLAIHIRHVNHAPVITTERLPVAYEGESYNASVSAFDIDSLIEDVGLQYAISPALSWLHVDPQTGMLSGVPLTQHISDTAFLVTAQDKQGYSDAKMLNIHVIGKGNVNFVENVRFANNLTCQIIPSTLDNLHYAKLQAEEDVAFQYYVYSITGHLVYTSQKQKLGRGTHYLPFDIKHQPTGVYIFVGVANSELGQSIMFINY